MTMGANISLNESLGNASPGGGPEWLDQVRQAALERFGELGFPTRREEEWKYTDTSLLQQLRLQAQMEFGGPAVTFDRISDFVLADSAQRLVFVNGRFSPGLSPLHDPPSEVRVESLASALYREPELLRPLFDGRESASGHEHPFAYLNAAFARDGALVIIPPGLVVDTPIELLFVTSASYDAPTSHPRVLVTVGDRSRIRLIETYLGVSETSYFTNAVTQLNIGPEAKVDHYKIQREAQEAYHVANTRVFQGEDSVFSSHSISLGGRLVRNDINAVLQGQGATCTMNGLYVADGEQHVDNHTSIDHTVPDCSSSQVYKGVVAGRATAVFNGKVFVRPDAQRTNATQSNRNLLLSDRAAVNTKPQLEIWADDVKCTHGATTGQLDEEALFYARTRGISKPAARQMLTYAFANELLDGFSSDAVRALVEHDVDAWLPKGEE